MTRSFRDLLKFSVPVLLSAAWLSGCGSGSNGSADLGQGPSTPTPPPPVTVTETFNFSASLCCFQVGTPPIHALFRDGEARIHLGQAYYNGGDLAGALSEWERAASLRPDDAALRETMYRR